LKFKLDENFGTRTQHIFESARFEVDTVRDEGLGGSSDEIIYNTCCSEKRCLVTLDLDFSNVLRFPPEKTGGIAVIRFHANPTLPQLEKLIRQFLKQLTVTSINKQLWIIEPNRIRIHQSAE